MRGNAVIRAIVAQKLFPEDIDACARKACFLKLATTPHANTCVRFLRCFNALTTLAFLSTLPNRH